MTKESKLKLITGEEAVNLMMYPMQKLDYPEPLLELLVLTKNLLVNNCKLLLIVGYSFRDDSIRRLILDAASKNSDLYIILIDKEPQSIYENRLKYFDKENKIPTPLMGKVICLPYKFEKVFPHIKNIYVKSLVECIAAEQKCIDAEIKGEKSSWLNVINLAANSEYVEIIINNEDKLNAENGFDIWSLISIYLKVTVNLFANNNKLSIKYLNIFHKLLSDVLYLYPNISSTNQQTIIFVTNYVKREGGSSYTDISTCIDKLTELRNFVQKRSELVFENNDELNKIAMLLVRILRILRNYINGIDLNKYLSDAIKQDRNIDKIVQITKDGQYQINDLDALNNKICQLETQDIDEIFHIVGYFKDF